MEEWVQEGKGPTESPAAPERSVMCGSWENLHLCTWFLPVSWLHQMFLECWLKALVPRLQDMPVFHVHTPLSSRATFQHVKQMNHSPT